MFGFGLETKLIGGACLLALAVMGFAYWTDSLRDEGRQECQAAHEKADRIEEQRRSTAVAEVSNEAQRMANRARADARGADDAAVRLRSAVTTRLAGVSDPAASAASAPARAPDVVLADVLGSAEKRLRELAALADERAVAGNACVRSYEALTK